MNTPMPAQKKTVISLGADNGFFRLDDSVRPLSTPCPPADNNYAADECQNQANKVVNGDHFFHGDWTNLNLYRFP
jgi:hypothetical protein